jgi:radical SAM protein with 4Fe4S-binding SPASM domain
MDGPEEIHDTLRRNWAGRGSWKDVDRGILKLKQAGAEVSLSMVLGKHSIDRAKETIQWFLDRYQPTGMGVNFMKPPTPQQKNYDQLIDEGYYSEIMYDIHRQFRDRGLFLELVFRKLQPFVEQRYRYHDCGAAGGTNLNIDAKGNIGPCKSFLIMKRLALGTLSAAEYSSQVIAQWRKRSPVYYHYCDNCNARGMCGNGCAYDAHVNSGNEMAVDSRSCRYTKGFHQLFIKDLYELTYPEKIGQESDWKYVSRDIRERLLGDVRARPHTLSYSIGHQTMD